MSSDIEFVLESAVRGIHVYRVAPRTVAEVTELVRQAVEQRTTRRGVYRQEFTEGVSSRLGLPRSGASALSVESFLGFLCAHFSDFEMRYRHARILQTQSVRCEHAAQDHSFYND